MSCRPSDRGYSTSLTSSPNEPLEFSTPTDIADDEPGREAEDLLEKESELAPGGYDDRQESLEEADRDVFARKQQDPDARYRAEDEPKTEPRKQPRHNG